MWKTLIEKYFLKTLNITLNMFRALFRVDQNDDFDK